MATDTALLAGWCQRLMVPCDGIAVGDQEWPKFGLPEVPKGNILTRNGGAWTIYK